MAKTSKAAEAQSSDVVSVEALLRKVEEQGRQIELQNQQMAALMNSHAALTGHLSGVTAQFAKSIPTEKQTEKILRRSRELSQRIAENERRLADGERIFKVSLSSEKTMARIVGSKDAANAEKRYLAHFGITGLTEPQRNFLVIEELDELPPLDEFPEFQLKPILRGQDADAESLRTKKPEMAVAG